jgi:hypothetical protein
LTAIDTVIAVAGWEDRFRLGVSKDLESRSPSELMIIAFEEYDTRTLEGRTAVVEMSGRFGIACNQVHVKRERRRLYATLRETFDPSIWRKRSVLVDISTMPREVIWWILSFLKAAECKVEYIYHRPEIYPSDWVTRDTDVPRLVYQHSGISAFGKETALLLLTGFDIERAHQLIRVFEPKQINVGLQVGTQYSNEIRNVTAARRELANLPNVQFFELDSFGSDQGYSAISEVIEALCGDYNLVAASLGPKPSAVSLYCAHLSHPEMALAYAPSRQLNPHYSQGIGASLSGSIAQS